MDLPHADAERFDENGESLVEDAGPVEIGDRGDHRDEEEDAGDDDSGEADESHEPSEDTPRRATDPFRVFDWCFLCHRARI